MGLFCSLFLLNLKLSSQQKSRSNTVVLNGTNMHQQDTKGTDIKGHWRTTIIDQYD